MNTACDFWAVLQANSARKATQIQRFPRSTESEPHNTRGKPPKSPEPWQYQDPFPAEPSRSRGTWTHANKEALRRTLIPLHSASASANRGGGETFKMDAPPSPVHQAAFPLAPSQLSGPIIGACLDNFQYSLHLQCAAITGFTSHAGDCPHYRCRQSPLEPQSQLLEQSLVVDSDRCGHCLPYPIWVFG